MTRSRRVAVAAAALVVLILAWLAFVMLATGPKGKVAVMIPKGASASHVAEVLARHRAVRSAFGFKLLAAVTGRSGSLKPGGYEIDPAAGPLSALGKIARGDVSARWVTIPEGYTIRRIGERLDEAKLGRAERFVELASHSGRSFPTSWQHPGDNLEGYLFPDTYLVPVGAREEDIIRMMLDAFGRKIVGPVADDLRSSGMDLHRCVTIASLVEREAAVPKDRALISAVIHNRLRRGMRLEIDATVLYALGGHKERVFYGDLEVDSPYNTYRNDGLPPGPIASPGLDAVRSALHPAAVDYLYYVARPDGSHIFSRTFVEHQQAIKKARRERGG
ncbi:MAG: endolytic transglycosylase MltG [Armatimonadetes bacterium]|nr:endolytic transglycosylase MltG [Armatimonadota bacterium]